VPGLLKAGQALQRFWLTATELGLALQPSLAPLCFAYLGKRGVAFTADPAIRQQAARLAGEVQELHPGADDRLVFFGRLGQPISRRVTARSVRRPLEELLVRSGG
jgi:hypothetical protein